MNENEYKKKMNQITVPPALIDETIRNVKKKSIKNRSRGWGRAMSIGSVAVAAVLLVIVAGRNLLINNSDFIRTDLKQNEHVAQVELKEGYLEFASQDDDFESKNFGLIHPNKKQWDREAYEDYISSTVVGMSTLDKEVYTLREERYTAYYKNLDTLDYVICEMEYTGKRGQKIIYYASDGLTDAIAKKKMNSKIGSVELEVSYHQSEDCYTAIFIKNENYIKITAVSMDQEEFIKNLYYFLI